MMFYRDDVLIRQVCRGMKVESVCVYNICKGLENKECAYMSDHIRKISSVVLFLIFLSVPVCLFGADLYVPSQFSTIEGAIGASSNGDVIWVADDLYQCTSVITIKSAITIKSEGGPDNCTIDLGTYSSSIKFEGTDGAEFRGFTIIGAGTASDGAVVCEGSSPKITECRIENNNTVGIFCVDSSPEIGDCDIMDNVGGILLQKSSPNIHSCTIDDNKYYNLKCEESSSPNLIGCEILRTDNNDGTSINCNNSSPEFHRCRISGSYGYSHYAVYFENSSEPYFVNCLITHNLTYYNRSVIYIDNSSPTFTNCTIANQISKERFIELKSSSPVFTNCIVWSSNPDAETISLSGDSNPIANYCDIQRGAEDPSYPGNGNINKDPQFVPKTFYTDYNYHILQSSPCINNGTDDVLDPEDIKDFEGNDRPAEGGYDIGAYEWVNTPPTAFMSISPEGIVDEGDTVTLDGTESYASELREIVSYAWTCNDPVLKLNGKTDSVCTFQAPKVERDGTFLTINLVVKDDGGLTHSVEDTIRVKWINTPPEAVASASSWSGYNSIKTIKEGKKGTLYGAGSKDNETDIASYQWTQVSGPQVEIKTPAQAEASFATPDIGPSGATLVFQLKVTDYGDDLSPALSDTDTCTYTIEWVNEAPVADAGLDMTVLEGAMVTLDATGSYDLDDGIVSYHWEEVKNSLSSWWNTTEAASTVTLSDPESPNPVFLAPIVDDMGITLKFKLTIVDSGEHDVEPVTDTVVVSIEDNGLADLPSDVYAYTSYTDRNIGMKVLSGGSLIEVNTVNPTSISDSRQGPDDFPYGLLGFRILTDEPGGTATVAIYLPESAPVGYDWYQYFANQGWVNLHSRASFNPDRTRITFSLTDGGFGDEDTIENSIIVDPSGLARSTDVNPEGGSEGPSGSDDDSGGYCFITVSGH